MTRQIRRTLYPSTYPCANGIEWLWFNDFNWIPYDLETSHLVEKEYNSNAHGTIDLEVTKLGIPNVIDLNKMVQINKYTGNERCIQRKVDPSFGYPLDFGSTASSAAITSNSTKSTASTNGAPSPNNRPTFNSQPMHAVATSTAVSDKVENTRKKLKLDGSHNSKDPLRMFCKDDINEDGLDDDCSICFEKLKDSSGFDDNSTASSTGQSHLDVRELKKCQHMFHGTCLLELISSCAKEGWLQCPTCKVIQGVKHGLQPKDGTMNVSRQAQSLAGFPGCGMIIVTYSFMTGIQQSQEHPHPGKRYYVSGFPRICYLPDNGKGQKVLRLLQKAWQRRLVFTIGMSNTTGQDDTLVWNEIHHKTEPFSNDSGHGYPDPNYLDNVLAELSIQGVDDDDDNAAS
ncbi:hypothetical protein QZH41_009794 [Actinostola sp. cb2023]|nr:hypothetical protein QZH41_009794 [Actinostola sp. cb2023]